jgi:O-antigen/teichoic acid export membrane protein
LGSLWSGALTATSMLLVSGVAAAIGVVIAREFGRTDETDGFLAAYGVFVVIAIAAQAIRLTVLPQLARARQEQRLAGELAGFAIALAVFAVPLLIATLLGASWLAGVLTGGESELAQKTAADALLWVVPAAVAHLFGALAASGLAALDDYGTAAVGYTLGSVAGLSLILLRVEPDGIVAVGWGMALNGTVALAVPLAGLAYKAARTQMPSRAMRPSGRPLRARLGVFAVGSSLPLAQQLLYVVCLPFAARLGTGEATSFVYGYIAAAALVTVTAGSLGIVTTVPLARSGLDVAETIRHVVATSWLALAVAGAAAGMFALAGGDLVEGVLGEAYGGDVGADLGRLVVALSPWIIASIGVAVTFPLAFVAGRTRGLPWIALAALVLQVPLAWAGSSLLDLDGLALSMGLTTLAILGALLRELDAFRETARELAVAALVVAGLAVLAFLPPALILGSIASALVGGLAYAVLLAVLRPRGLVAGWRYLRALT